MYDSQYVEKKPGWETCVHHWEIGTGKLEALGTCKKCGSIAKFDNYCDLRKLYSLKKTARPMTNAEKVEKFVEEIAITI
jgi:hypothetical protein